LLIILTSVLPWLNTVSTIKSKRFQVYVDWSAEIWFSTEEIQFPFVAASGMGLGPAETPILLFLAALWEKSSQHIKLTIYFHLVLRLGMRGGTPPLSYDFKLCNLSTEIRLYGMVLN
jgi:hypothetical protein